MGNRIITGRRLAAALLLLLTAFVSVPAALAAKPTLSFSRSYPEAGSTVTSFEFDLEFDFSAVYEQYGYDDRFGIFIGSSSKTGIKLYKGHDGRGDLLQTLHDYNTSSRPEEFRPGNKLHVNFDKAPMIAGEEYALVIDGILVNAAKSVDDRGYTSTLSFDEPLVINFTAGADNGLFGIRNWTVRDGSRVEHIGKVEIEFTHPVTVVEEIEAELYYYDRISYGVGSYAEKYHVLERASVVADETDPCKVTVDFGDYPTYEGWVYDIQIPAEAICRKDNPEETVPAIKRRVSGSLVEYFKAKAVKPVYDKYGLVEAVTVTWETPQPRQTGVSLAFETTLGYHLTLKSDDRLSGGGTLKTIMENNWPEVTYKISGSLVPGLTYHLAATEDYLTGCVKDPEGTDVRYVPGLRCSEFEGVIVAPTQKEMAVSMPAVRYMSYGLSEHNDRTQSLAPGYKTDYLESIDIALRDYTFEGTDYSVSLGGADNDMSMCYFYEIVPGGEDVLLCRYQMKRSMRGITGVTDRYNAVVCTVKKKLYEGKSYKLVIPENSFSLDPPKSTDEISFKYYPRSPKFEFLFTGGAPSEVILKSTNVADGAELSELGWVVWEFDGDAAIVDGKKAQLKMIGSSSVTSKELTAVKSGGSTYVKADFSITTSGERKALTNGMQYTVTLPAGAVTDPSDATVLNKESVINIKGIKASGPEYASISLTVGDLHKTSHKSLKGESMTVTLGHGDWKVESLVLDGEDRTAEVAADGSFTFVPAADASIAATLGYAGEWMVEHQSGVFAVEDSAVRVHAQNGQIVIEGLTAADEVSVHTVGGLLVNSVRPEQDTVRISVAKGAYIVIVNGRAAKIVL